MGTIIILLAAIIICVVILAKLLKTIFGTVKSTAHQVKTINAAETYGADAILNKYVKEGKIPSWAYDGMVQELKQYCRNTKLLVFEDYLDKHKPEIIDLPVDFKLAMPSSISILIETCVVRFRDFDLENYKKTKQLSEYERETLMYLSRMWYFSDPACHSLEDGNAEVKACLENFLDAGNPNSRNRYHQYNQQKYKDLL